MSHAPRSSSSAGWTLFGIDVAGAKALDIGASTGGFTQVLLERGAAHVTAIDVGHGQLHQSLSDDPRVTSIEGLNARELCACPPGRGRARYAGFRCELHLAQAGAAAGAWPGRPRAPRASFW